MNFEGIFSLIGLIAFAVFIGCLILTAFLKGGLVIGVGVISVMIFLVCLCVLNG